MERLYLPAKRESFEEVMAFIDSNLEAMDCPMKVQMALDIAVEEIYINIASYAYPEENADGKGMAEIEIAATVDRPGVSIIFKDSGVPYNPLEKPDPDVTLSAEEREIGGLGIFMVKKSMDETLYSYENAQNILTIIKYF